VYAARDREGRRQNVHAKKKGNEEEEEEMAFRDMHAAERSLSLNRRSGTDGKQQSDLDEIRNSIREFKSHINFPEGAKGGASASHQPGNGFGGRDSKERFGRVGFVNLVLSLFFEVFACTHAHEEKTDVALRSRAR
jgi:hypothetical protein